MSFYFGDKTSPQIAEAIERNTIAILPIGTTEEHGGHLPVSTDALVARHMGECLGRACDEAGIPVLVLETINYGFSMKIIRKWPGCPNIDSDVFVSYIHSMVASLVIMGFKKITLLDCHGNHDCLLRTVMRKIADEFGVYIMVLSPFKLSDAVYRQMRKDPEGDIHGGEWETSAILHIRPDLVDKSRYTDVDAIRCNSPLRGPVSTWGLQESRTGLVGDPTHATPELGKALFEAITGEGLKYLKAFYEHTEQSR